MLLIECYLRRGQRGAVLAQIVHCVDAVRRMDGAEPSQRARAFFATVRQQTWQPGAVVPAIAAPTRTLYGRETEYQRLTGLFATTDQRLVTIVGAGGMGKSTLARAVGAALSRSFRDGAVFVALEHCSDLATALTALGNALRIDLAQHGSRLERLIECLTELEILCVLDNCEQVAELPEAIAALLAGCPKLAIMATSRVPLELQQEYVFPLYGLPTTPGVPTDMRRANPAVDLFLARARQINN